MSQLPSLEARLRTAVRRFWATRAAQAKRQGSVTGTKDAGARAAVTGGAQMNGFVSLVRELVRENGLGPADVLCDKALELPGWYRCEKKWDLLIVVEGELVAAVEFKSQIGSFGNNFNNRVEEAIGSATDLWAAYREGAFKPSARPWLGYLMLLEETAASTRPVGCREPHFAVFPEFRDASYSRRYELFLTKLIRERLYDSACFLLSDPVGGARGTYREPAPEPSFQSFTTALLRRVIAVDRTGR